MESYKEYRFKDNPKEKEFYDNFVKQFGNNSKTISAIIFGWENEQQTIPKDYLLQRERNICANLIQWLGSPVGQAFLANCGFTETKQK